MINIPMMATEVGGGVTMMRIMMINVNDDEEDDNDDDDHANDGDIGRRRGDGGSRLCRVLPY